MRGFPSWCYEPVRGVLGCPAVLWRYLDDTSLVPFRGLPWEAVDTLLGNFDLDMPEAASRKIFSDVYEISGTQAQKDGIGFIPPQVLWKVIEYLTAECRPISLSGFEKVLQKAGVTLPSHVVKRIFLQLDDITLHDKFTCEDLVDFNKLAPLVSQYLSGGMWLEAVHGVLLDEELETNIADVARAFNEIDRRGLGILKPSDVVRLMMALNRTGIGYPTFREMILKDMQFAVDEHLLRIIFNMVDSSGNGDLCLEEFVTGFLYLVRRLLPNMILRSLNLLPEQIAATIFGAAGLLLLLLLFASVSMQALKSSADSGGTHIAGGAQSALAAVAAFGVKAQSTTGLDAESIKDAMIRSIHELLPGITMSAFKK